MALNDMIIESGPTRVIQGGNSVAFSSGYFRSGTNILSASDSPGYPFVVIGVELRVNFTPGNWTPGAHIALYQQLLQLDLGDGTTVDEDPPSAARREGRIFTFSLSDQTTFQAFESRPLVRSTRYDTRYWIENQAGLSVRTGWRISAHPITFGSSAYA